MFGYSYAAAGVGGSWWGIGAVAIGILILIAICCVFVCLF